MTPDEIAAKFGGVVDGDKADAIAARFGGRPAINQAAMDPEVQLPFGLGTIKGDYGGAMGFNPAAALINAGDWWAGINRSMAKARELPTSLLRGRPTELSSSIDQAEAFAKKPMQDLREVHPGSAEIGKTVAMLGMSPASVPAALPVLAGFEEGDPMERAGRVAAASAGVGITKLAGNYLAKTPERLANAQTINKVRDEFIASAQDKGYAFAPSTTGAGWGSRFMEGVSGKAKTEQALSLKNQPVTDALARLELKLDADAALTPSAIEGVRSAAYNAGYAPIKDLKAVNADSRLIDDLLSASPQSAGGAVKSPATKEITGIIDSIANKGQWTGSQIVRDIQRLREMGRANANSAAVAGGDAAKSELASAQIQMADALEQLAERNIIAQGGKPGAVQSLREARTLIAKSHDIEDALINGSVDLAKAGKAAGDKGTGAFELWNKLAKDKALSKSVVMPVSGAANPVTALDAFGAAVTGTATGNPLAAVAMPAARIGARALITSQPYQRMFARPNYAQGWVSRGATPLLDNPYAPLGVGMFGYNSSP